MPPNRYIFHGAEVYSDYNDSDASDSDDAAPPFSLMFDNESADPENMNEGEGSSSSSSSPTRNVENLNSSVDLNDAVNDKDCPDMP